MKHSCGKFFLLILGLLACANAQAKPKYAAEIEALIREGEAAKKALLTSTPNKAQWHSRAQEVTQQINGPLTEAFSEAVAQIIDSLRTPSAAELQGVKDLIASDLAALEGSSDEKGSPLKEKESHPLSRIDPQAQALLRASILSGKPEAALELLELCSAYTASMYAYLLFSHVQRVTDPALPLLDSVEWDVFERLSEGLEYTLMVGSTFFPTLPDFHWGQAATPWAAKYLIPQFQKTFADGVGQISENNRERIAAALKTYSDAVGQVEIYRVVFFPRLANDTFQKYLIGSLFTLSGSEDCINLAGGTSRFYGAPCPAAAFKRNLLHFMKYDNQLGDTKLFELMLSSVARYRQGEAESDDPWETFTKEIRALSKAKLTPHAAQALPKLIAELLESNSEGEPVIRTMMDDHSVTGTQIFKHLRALFTKYQLHTRSGGQNETEVGNIEDFTPDVQAIEAIRKGFEKNVEDPLRQSTLVEDPRLPELIQAKQQALAQKLNRALRDDEIAAARSEALLELLQSKIVRFDASNKWCEVFDMPETLPLPKRPRPERHTEVAMSQAQTRRDRRAREESARLWDEQAERARWQENVQRLRANKRIVSPWVINAERVDRSHDPVFGNSANGFQRAIPSFEAHYANAVTIQNIDEPKIMFAGIAVRTALGMIIPNIVHATLIVDHRIPESTAEAYHIKRNHKEVMGKAMRKYGFPDEDVIVEQSRAAFWEMLKRWGLKKGLLKIDGEQKMGASEYTEALEAKMASEYASLHTRFNWEMSQEMEAAARALREWDRKIEALKNEGPINSKTILEDVLDPEMAKAILSKAGPAARGFSHDLPHWMDFFKKTHAFHRDYPEASDDKVVWWADTTSEVPKGTLTYEEFRAQFIRHGVAIMGDNARIMMDDNYLPGHPLHALSLPKIYEYALNIYDRKIDYMEYARNLILYRFPALKLNDAYKNYRGGIGEFYSAMLNYLEHCLTQATMYQELGGSWGYFFTERDVEKQADKINDYVFRNLPLLDVILRFFPDQKAFVCRERAARGLYDAVYDTALQSGEMAGASLAFMGMVATCFIGPQAVLLPLVAFGVTVGCALASSYRAYEKWQDLNATRDWDVAASPQLGPEDTARNLDYVREREKAYSAAWNAAAWDVVIAATAYAPFSPKVGGTTVAGREINNTVRAQRLRQILALPFRLLTKEGRVAFRQWGQRAKIIKAWERPTLRERFIQAFVRPSRGTTQLLAAPAEYTGGLADGLIALEQAPRALGQLAGGLGDVLLHNPAFLLGMEFNFASWQGWAAWTAINAGDIAALYGVGSYILNYAENSAIQRTMERVYENPLAYKDLIEMVRMGKISQGELVQLFEADDELSHIYLAEAENAKKKVVEYVGRHGIDNGEPMDVQKARARISEIYGEMKRRLDNSHPMADGFDPKYEALKRRVSEMQKTWIEHGQH